jgi:arabinogalactan endo-1,4-beta-galactosidase
VDYFSGLAETEIFSLIKQTIEKLGIRFDVFYNEKSLYETGKIDAVIESDVNILDIAALTVIVEEAGGRFTDLDGGPVDLATTTVLASNGALHDTVLGALR